MEEEIMPESRTYHWLNSTQLVCIGFYLLGQAETLPRHVANIVVSDMIKLGGRR
jgi:hypothetical protein